MKKTPNGKDVGQAIARIRTAAGLSQADLGAKLGKSRSGIATFERPTANPRWSSITDALTASESTPLVLLLVAMGWELRLAEQLASLVEQLTPETVLSRLQVVPRSRDSRDLEGVADLLRQAADRLASW